MLLARRVRDELIAGQWEELMRLAGSIKRGWIVPSILLTRMHADPRPDRLAKALREYGRVVRTNFILDWAGDPGLTNYPLDAQVYVTPIIAHEMLSSWPVRNIGTKCPAKRRLGRCGAAVS